MPMRAVPLAVALLSAATADVLAGASDDPVLWAHRGGRDDSPGAPPDNSLRAFASAGPAGANGVELDVHLTRDGQIVVYHDRRVILPSGKRAPIHRLTLPELRTIDLGDGDRIPTLEEVVAVVDPGLAINIEIKPDSRKRARRLERKVVALVNELGVAQRVVYSSFSPLTVRHLARLAPGADVGLLVWPGLRGRVATRLVRTRAIHPLIDMVTPKAVARWHRQGFTNIRPYPHPRGGDDPARLRSAARLGAGPLIVDDVRKARTALRSAHQIKRSPRR